jgi:hypothetical protein
MKPFPSFIFLFAALNASSAQASCLEEVVAFAERICGEIDRSGSRKVIDARGQISADV